MTNPSVLQQRAMYKKPLPLPADAIMVDEVAEIIGCNPSTILSLTKRNGGIPYVRLGTRWVFSRSAVERWLRMSNYKPKVKAR